MATLNNSKPRVLKDQTQIDYKALYEAQLKANEALKAQGAAKIGWNTDGWRSAKSGKSGDSINITGDFWPAVCLTPRKAEALAACLEDPEFRKALKAMAAK